MLYYLPLEQYPERYTLQLSAPVTGWWERNWWAAGVEYSRIEGEPGTSAIRTGVVLDAARRARHCFAQVNRLLALAESGDLKSSDVIYLDDFWHPGAEALPYAFHLLGIRPRAYAYLWAQSVDEYDFTYLMRSWLRHFERGIGEWLDGVFVASSGLKDLLCSAGLVPWNRAHVVGLPFDSTEVRSRMPAVQPLRRDRVVFSSRWDREKNPGFFLKVAAAVLAVRPDVEFVVCTSSPRLRSNYRPLLGLLDDYRKLFPQITLREGLTKEQYYEVLCSSKIQFNCADQDWVSFTLLEASVAGCYPVYPDFRSFPETLRYSPDYLYRRGDAEGAAWLVLSALSGNHWTPDAIASREWIHSRFDRTWERVLSVMGLSETEVPSPYGEQG